MDQAALLQLVPVGEEHAISARSIWEIEGVWAPASIKTKLDQLANEGLIQRRFVPLGQNRKTLYSGRQPRRDRKITSNVWTDADKELLKSL